MKAIKRYLCEVESFPRYGLQLFWSLAWIMGFVAGFGWAR